ncbi:hypothetical protein AVEN_138303-1 [Araneus ventricosus]|uniref:DNA helicase Pif1-like 2B domain-containing protein n=1 Tax=Araneus ventricosus TaxID=182803 RepID=A0A4Y2G3I4_ARAVE|nr:hypothetical protein AVEN_138303-1 [Araneus ventricosus]
MNKHLLQELPRSVQVDKSIDTTCDTNEAVKYPSEFLNTLEPSGVHSHRLELKIGAPIMLPRNLHPPSLCNGTRLCIKKLMPNITEVTINDWTCRCLSFAMSINKAQGQSLKVVRLDLLKPCFSHGQLYVGCSRVGKAHNLYILAPNGRTTNIVYPEVVAKHFKQEKIASVL